MQVTNTTFLPLLFGEKRRPGYVADEFDAGLAVEYTFGPPYGERGVTHDDLGQLGLSRTELRTTALTNLESLLDRVRLHGQPPALTLSFDGLESSLLVGAGDLWNRLGKLVDGDLVVGAPARDVVVVTGTGSSAGLDRVRRTVDRVYFAGDENLLTSGLLVRRHGGWEPLQ